MIKLTPLSFTTYVDPDDHSNKPHYGFKAYITHGGHFYLGREPIFEEQENKNGAWHAFAVSYFQSEYPDAYERFEEEGIEEVPFKRRSDALDAIATFLDAEGIKWQQ